MVVPVVPVLTTLMQLLAVELNVYILLTDKNQCHIVDLIIFFFLKKKNYN